MENNPRFMSRCLGWCFAAAPLLFAYNPFFCLDNRFHYFTIFITHDLFRCRNFSSFAPFIAGVFCVFVDSICTIYSISQAISDKKKQDFLYSGVAGAIRIAQQHSCNEIHSHIKCNKIHMDVPYRHGHLARLKTMRTTHTHTHTVAQNTIHDMHECECDDILLNCVIRYI